MVTFWENRRILIGLIVLVGVAIIVVQSFPVFDSKEEAGPEKIPEGWDKYEEEELGFSFYRPNEFGQPVRTVVNASPSVKANITGRKVTVNFNGSLVFIAESTDFCLYKSDQLFNSSVCRNFNVYPRKCESYQDFELCKEQTFKDSFQFEALKRYEHKDYKFYFIYSLTDECSVNNCPTIEQVKENREKKIDQFVNITKTVRLD